MSDQIKEVKIDDLLMKVEKPARYLGNEMNSAHKEINEDMVRFAFAFPDTYEIGMSHLGMQILYHLLNEQQDIFCERVFSPNTDMENLLRREERPLFALETKTPLKAFDFIGFTLQYELSYTNILNILDMGEIPLFQKDREEEDPIIILGGPCSYNPEPIADFADIIVLGEGEEIILEVINLYKKIKQKPNYQKADFLLAASEIEGIYVPSHFAVDYHADGRIKEVRSTEKSGGEQGLKKRIIEDLDKAYYPDKILVPYIDTVHNRVVLEIFRGCIRGCRFCQAGMIYRPVRERSLEKLQTMAHDLLQNTGYEEISLASLSSSDYTEIEALIHHLIEINQKDHIGVSLPSLRLDNFSKELIEEIQKVRKTGLTFAPEAGTQRLRDVINKNIREEDLLNSAKEAFEMGYNNIKLYFMIGLPTETDEDILGIKELVYKVLNQYHSLPKEKRAGGLKITVSTSTFVPKAFTPFQWEEQISLEEIHRRQSILKESLTHRSINYNYHDGKTSVVEGAFARGDRRLSKVLYKAYSLGCKFDGWGDHFDYQKWVKAFEEEDSSLDFYSHRKRSYDEILPWDHFDIGVNKSYLMQENNKAKIEEVTPDCRLNCSACGINQKFTSRGGVC
ncbi:TIGR03960 family B12-binding radical SAM protein [Isachenkonia alkalipeptolytica]|uniref:TIGR03960 family B12-binding radical SAM protein n=1 Tax=Isachenkonia alkalipeptolytica TaxID=2565777 RepID=A0AA44BEG0_9CLOT|nr:TIGR03960 family B12-binding radical SAM protein [Isachenkonia alkalipeptolytica]NBG88948.1 TIGR03960 family B12-binding radical SAM protein [Isachenkonia alkalipeptolytica]